jgi:hypothetical protein
MDQYLFEREMTRQDSHFNEETLPIDHGIESNKAHPPFHNAKTLQQDESIALSFGIATKNLAPEHRADTLSDGEDSVVMETDGEPAPQEPSTSSLKLADYVVPISGWMQSPVVSIT